MQWRRHGWPDKPGLSDQARLATRHQCQSAPADWHFSCGAGSSSISNARRRALRRVMPSASPATPQREAYRACASGRASCGARLCQTVPAGIALLCPAFRALPPPDKRRRITN